MSEESKTEEAWFLKFPWWAECARILAAGHLPFMLGGCGTWMYGKEATKEEIAQFIGDDPDKYNFAQVAAEYSAAFQANVKL